MALAYRIKMRDSTSRFAPPSLSKGNVVTSVKIRGKSGLKLDDRARHKRDSVVVTRTRASIVGSEHAVDITNLQDECARGCPCAIDLAG